MLFVSWLRRIAAACRTRQRGFQHRVSQYEKVQDSHCLSRQIEPLEVRSLMTSDPIPASVEGL